VSYLRQLYIVFLHLSTGISNFGSFWNPTGILRTLFIKIINKVFTNQIAVWYNSFVAASAANYYALKDSLTA
jgi:hypothetical protein